MEDKQPHTIKAHDSEFGVMYHYMQIFCRDPPRCTIIHSKVLFILFFKLEIVDASINIRSYNIFLSQSFGEIASAEGFSSPEGKYFGSMKIQAPFCCI